MSKNSEKLPTSSKIPDFMHTRKCYTEFSDYYSYKANTTSGRNFYTSFYDNAYRSKPLPWLRLSVETGVFAPRKPFYACPVCGVDLKYYSNLKKPCKSCGEVDNAAPEW